MKTSIYNKKEHIEGYVGSGDEQSEKSDVQKHSKKATILML